MKCNFEDWGTRCSPGVALGIINDIAIKFYSLVAVTSFVKFRLSCEKLKLKINRLSTGPGSTCSPALGRLRWEGHEFMVT